MNKRIAEFIIAQYREWKGFILFFLFVFVPVRSCLADWNWVPSGSMNPTILEGDLVYVNKLAYDLRFPLTLHSLKRWSDPEKGDISVLFSPEDGIRLVKRVIGVPGDVIEMKNNVLYINRSRLQYSELPKEQTRDLEEEIRRISIFAEEDLAGRRHAVMSVPSIPTGKRSFERLVVPDGHYFVVGDNRDLSKDSRYFGFVERSQFVGKATNVIVSFNMLDKYQPRFNRFFTSLN